jgi:hypothetical protein
MIKRLLTLVAVACAFSLTLGIYLTDRVTEKAGVRILTRQDALLLVTRIPRRVDRIAVATIRKATLILRKAEDTLRM